MLDSSGSIRASNRDGVDNWKLMLTFVKNLVKKMKLATGQSRVGLVIYSDEARSEFLLSDSNDKHYLETLIDGLESKYEGGSTNTAAALREMHYNQFQELNGDRPGVKNVALLITDGVSTIDKENTVPEALVG